MANYQAGTFNDLVNAINTANGTPDNDTIQLTAAITSTAQLTTIGTDTSGSLTIGSVAGANYGISGTTALNKAGTSSLTLSSTNGYTGSTNIFGGTLDLAALGAAGPNAINFARNANATLQIESAALASGRFGNTIAGYAVGDAIDVRGIGTDTATFNYATDALVLTNASGGTTTLQLSGSFNGQAFNAASDGAGGTVVTLAAPVGPPTVTVKLADDTGSSATDGYTRDAALTGTADPGATVSFSENGASLGTTVANANGVFNFTPAGLAQGQQTITATESRYNLAGSAAVTLSYDTTAPTITAPKLTVQPNAGATPIGIGATDNVSPAASLAATIFSLPTDGTVTLADGTTRVSVNQNLTQGQLTGLKFTPTPGQINQSSTLTYGVSDLAGNTTVASDTLAVGGPVSTTNAVSINQLVAYNGGGVFTLTGKAQATAGVSRVEITATNNGVAQDLGTATLSADGTFSFKDRVLSNVQGFITATETDGNGNQLSSQANFSLQGGLNNNGFTARQTRYAADGTTQTAVSLFREDGSRRVDIMNNGATYQSYAFDTFLNGGEPNNTFVFNQNHGLDVIRGFRVDGTDHDTISLPQSDFTSIAQVLQNTQTQGGNSTITDPTTGDTVRLAGITKAQLTANQGDFTFHA